MINIEDEIARFFKRGQAVKLAGGIARYEVEEGKQVPEGWAFDAELEYYIPPNFHFVDTVQ